MFPALPPEPWWECLTPATGKYVLVKLRENPLPAGVASCRGSAVEARFGELFPKGFVLGRELAPSMGLGGVGYFQPYILGDLCSSDPTRGIPDSCEWSVEDAATETCSYNLHRAADYQDFRGQPVEFHIDRHLTLSPNETVEVGAAFLSAALPAGLVFRPARMRVFSMSLVHDEECALDFDAAYALVPDSYDYSAPGPT